ncbi:hypothetical protein [Nonomuraea rhodomycinica]|uniref:Beta-lactamase n=1 Tax=Nonomuraea rhodomycinica TaxID=1712872 RepID=A0A7Y6IQ54_9ACTN|nr:hypothetical protein [Nonomuraea rhodomycinica]NUW41034.1 hypothetical protein [Nonomuraea rhodomycinica]
MRTVRKIAVATSMAVGAAVPLAVMAPAANAQGTAFMAYHGVSAAEQKERFETLRAQGYRPVAVDVSGGGRYAAVWVKDGVRPWALYQGMSAKGYQQRFDQASKSGMQPVSVSATGAGDGARFVAAFARTGAKFFAKHGLTGGQLAAANSSAKGRGYALTSVDAYGTAGDIRYVAVWTQDTRGDWECTTGKTLSQHEAEFKSRTKRGYRPTEIAVAPDGTYTAVWRKDGLKSWAHYVGMSGSGYQQRFDQLKAKGLRPVQVDGEGGHYAAVFEAGR